MPYLPRPIASDSQMAVVPGGLGRAKSDWSRGLISESKSDDEAVADGLPVGAI